MAYNLKKRHKKELTFGSVCGNLSKVIEKTKQSVHSHHSTEVTIG